MRTAGFPGYSGYFCRRKIGGKARASGPVLLLLVLGVASLAGCTFKIPLATPVPSQFQYTERREEAV